MVRQVSFSHESGGGYVAMPSPLTNDEQIQRLTMTVKTHETDGLVFYTADDPVPPLAYLLTRLLIWRPQLNQGQ